MRARTTAIALCLQVIVWSASADEHDAYEEVQPRIEDVAAVHHASADWTRMHDVAFEFTAMVLGFHADRKLVLKLRNAEPMYWAAQLAGAPSLIPINMSHTGTMRDPNLRLYLAERGVQSQAARAGDKFLFVDASIDHFNAFNAVNNTAFDDELRLRYPMMLRSIVGPANRPELNGWTALLRFTGDALLGGDEAGFVDRYNQERMRFSMNWERSAVIPHFTGNSERYERRNGRWVAMARRDRKVVSWDHTFGDLAAERDRAVRYMQDLKAHFTSEPARGAFAARRSMWSNIRGAADDGDWDRLADVLEEQHRQEPVRAEAVARDVLLMLKHGHARRAPDLADEDLLRARSPRPVRPWLVDRLRKAGKAAAPRR